MTAPAEAVPVQISTRPLSGTAPVDAVPVHISKRPLSGMAPVDAVPVQISGRPSSGTAPVDAVPVQISLWNLSGMAPVDAIPVQISSWPLSGMAPLTLSLSRFQGGLGEALAILYTCTHLCIDACRHMKKHFWYAASIIYKHRALSLELLRYCTERPLSIH